jgi:oligopeptide/dipeptide ABC transporter ATP-binding protein
MHGVTYRRPADLVNRHHPDRPFRNHNPVGRTLGREELAIPTSLLNMQGLSVAFPSTEGEVYAVDRVSYALSADRTLGVVGESGCGKSLTALALLQLVPPPGRIVAGQVRWQGKNLLALSPRQMEAVRGDRIAMIFQEPMMALNPVYTVGDQIAEVLVLHRGASKREAWEQAIELLAEVGIPAAQRRAGDYPHRLSGGMRQRVMIAMAIACHPHLLIADEPTTALDVTVQAQILDLLLRLQAQVGMAIQFISHNLGVIAQVADEVAVMYAGRIVEQAPADELLATPAHPYTEGLLDTVPQVGQRQRRLPAIPGTVPTPAVRPRGCAFRNRCQKAVPRCAETEPALEQVSPGHQVACFVVTGSA